MQLVTWRLDLTNGKAFCMGEQDWREVADAQDIEEDEPFAVNVDEHEIVLCRVGSDIYAIDNICSHEYAQLSDGFIEGDCIECPLHQAQFHLPSGKAMSPPADEDLRTFPVKIVDGTVFVNIK